MVHEGVSESKISKKVDQYDMKMISYPDVYLSRCQPTCSVNESFLFQQYIFVSKVNV